MANFDAGKYGIVTRIINGYLVVHSPEFGITITKRFDEIRKAEDIGGVYLDLLKKITEDVTKRAKKNEKIPTPKTPLELVPKGEPSNLSIQEVAQILQTSPTTVRRLVDSGKLKCKLTFGKHRRFRVKDIEEFLGQDESPT